MSHRVPTNIVTVEPLSEPVTADDVKVNVPIVDDATDDKFIREQLIPTARKYVENLANRSLITQTRKQIYDYMPCAPIYLRYSPVQSVSSFTYTDSSETVQTLSSTYYDVDTASKPARIRQGYGQSWPSAADVTNSVNITYVAGYGTQGSSVPIIYRRAIILLCSHWYWNRSEMGCVSGNLLNNLENMLSIEGRTVEYA